MGHPAPGNRAGGQNPHLTKTALRLRSGQAAVATDITVCAASLGWFNVTTHLCPQKLLFSPQKLIPPRRGLKPICATRRTSSQQFETKKNIFARAAARRRLRASTRRVD